MFQNTVTFIRARGSELQNVLQALQLYPVVAFLCDITLHKWKKNKESGKKKIWLVIENSANIFKLVAEILGYANGVQLFISRARAHSLKETELTEFSKHKVIHDILKHLTGRPGVHKILRPSGNQQPTGVYHQHTESSTQQHKFFF